MVQRLSPTGSAVELADLGYDGLSWDKPWNLSRGQITTCERMPSARLEPTAPATPIPHGQELDLEAGHYTDPLTGRTMTAAQILERRLCSDALMVVHRGTIVHESYRNGVSEHDLHLVHSCSKTLTTMMIGWAVSEGRISTGQTMQDLVVELADMPAWHGVTVQHVLDMAAGLDTEEHYEHADSMYWRYADAIGYYTVPDTRQVGALEFVRRELVTRLEAPGSRFNYASYLTNLLPVVLERQYAIPAVDLYQQRLFSQIGAERHGLINLDATGAPITEGHVNLTLRDFARWSYPMINGGRSFTGNQVVPTSWVDETFTHDPARAAAFQAGDFADIFAGAEYHNQAWILQPDRVIAMLGIHGQFAYLDRRNDLMIIGLSSFPDQVNAVLITTLQQLWAQITTLIHS